MKPETPGLPLAGPDDSLRQVIAVIDLYARGIALVVDRGQLQQTITDGDIRRAILRNVDLETKVRNYKSTSDPVTAPAGTDDARLLQLMRLHRLRHIPLIGDDERIAGLVELADLVPEELEPPWSALVMAGGFGTRLLPRTENIPKPMLPVGGQPLLERIIERLQGAGIRKVHIATHFQSRVIEDHFADGQNFGVDIRYIRESTPLGTAGALGQLEDLDHPLLIVNGDILTDVDPRAMLHYHDEHEADMTVAVKEFEYRVPYGTVEIEDSMITGISEKPLVREFINAGMYLVEPDVCRSLPKGRSCDMPDLIHRLLAEERRVVSFPIRESWIDVGHHDDYEKAQQLVERASIE